MHTLSACIVLLALIWYNLSSVLVPVESAILERNCFSNQEKMLCLEGCYISTFVQWLFLPFFCFLFFLGGKREEGEKKEGKKEGGEVALGMGKRNPFIMDVFVVLFIFLPCGGLMFFPRFFFLFLHFLKKVCAPAIMIRPFIHVRLEHH